MINQSAGRISMMVLTALLTAFAFTSTLFLSVKDIGGFLTYDPKDVFITIIGFSIGPLWAMLSALVVQCLEMLMLSSTGLIGFLMGAVASMSFCVPAAILYRHKPTVRGSIFALLVGSISLSMVLLIFNYLITPLYLQMPRAEVIGLLKTIIIPFNLLKAGINSVLILLLYPPLHRALKKAKLLPATPAASPKSTLQLLSLFLILVIITIIALAIFLGQGA